VGVQMEAFLSYQTGSPDRQLVLTAEQVEPAIREIRASSVRAWDHETNGTAWWAHARPCGTSFGVVGENGRTRSWYFPWGHETGERQLRWEEVGRQLGQLFSDPGVLWCGHNAKFDQHMNRVLGWAIPAKVYDTMIAAHLTDPDRRSLGLKNCAELDCRQKDAHDWEGRVKAQVAELAYQQRLGLEVYRARYGYSQVPIALVGPYACMDIEQVLMLRAEYEQRQGLSTGVQARVCATEMRLVSVLTAMEERGMLVDVEYLTTLRRTLEEAQYQLDQQICQLVGGRMDLRSDDHLRDWLIGSLHLQLTKLTKTRASLSVDEEVLTALKDAHPAIPLILQWREAEKIRSTYTGSLLEKLDSKCVVHPNYQQVGPTTGRTSCREPNLQNQPSDDDDRARQASGLPLEHGGRDPWSIRRAYTVPAGQCRLFADYSQIELRVMAYYSADPILRDVYARGEDLHSRTSLEIFGTKEKAKRRIAKVANFGKAYGQTDAGLAQQAGISLEEAQAFNARYDQRFVVFTQWKRDFLRTVRENGCRYTNRWGRQRSFPDLNHPERWMREKAERACIASYVQGTAAELSKESLVRVYDRVTAEGLALCQIGLVHDEIQADMPVDQVVRGVRVLREEMERYPEMAPVPVVVEVEWSTTNWSEKKKLGR